MAEGAYSTAPLHAVKGVQVESNGPLRPVICQSYAAANLHYGELMPSAAELAADKQAEMERKKKAKAAQAAKFRKDTLLRLKEAAEKKRDAALAIEAAAAEEKRQAASEPIIVERGSSASAKPVTHARSLPSKSDQADDAEAPAAPSQLATLRAGLNEQAVAARMAMLSQAELGEIYATASAQQEAAAVYAAHARAYADGQAEPTPAEPTSGGAAAGSGSGGRANSSSPLTRVDPAAAKSTLRAVVESAALADRHAAREAREKREAEAKRSALREELAQRATARAAARKERAEMERKVAELEAQAQAAEAELSAAAALKAEYAKTQRANETERYFEALRVKLRAEASMRTKPLPPLCTCGLDPLDNHTELCARNCIFFNNPAAYGRALSGLFVRPIVLD